MVIFSQCVTSISPSFLKGKSRLGRNKEDRGTCNRFKRISYLRNDRTMQLGLLCCTSKFTEKGNSCTRLSTLHIFFFSILSCIIYLLSFILKGSKKHVCRNHACLYTYVFTYARDRIQAILSDLALYYHSFVKIRFKILLLPDADIF